MKTQTHKQVGKMLKNEQKCRETRNVNKKYIYCTTLTYELSNNSVRLFKTLLKFILYYNMYSNRIIYKQCQGIS